MSNMTGGGDRLPAYGQSNSSGGGYSQSANSSGTQQNFRKLYIRNLQFKVVSEDLKDAFSKYG